MTNERSGREDDKSLVACIRDGCISAVAVQRRGCTEEDSRREISRPPLQSSSSSAAAAAAAERKERKQRGEVWIGFVNFVGRRLTVDFSGVR